MKKGGKKDISRSGGEPCRARMLLSCNCNRNSVRPWNLWSVLARRPRLLPSAAGSSSALLLLTTPPTRTSPPNWVAIATPLAAGANALSPRASKACKTPLAPADPGAFPPEERLSVISLASSKITEQDSVNSSWTLDELAFTLVNQKANEERFLRHLEEATQQARQDYLQEQAGEATLPSCGEGGVRSLSRSTIQRILAEADLKPHKSVYWLNSHDPDFDFKATDICRLYLAAPRMYQEGRLVLSSDEKTGMQILGRKYPTQPAQPGKPAKREFEYIRHGTRCLLTTFCVPTGEVVWEVGQTRTSLDWVAHWRQGGAFLGLEGLRL